MRTTTMRSLAAALVAPACTAALASLLSFGLLFFGLSAGGCKSSARHTSDPRLTQIDQLINKQLPPGTPQSRVIFFLQSRGYPVDPAEGGNAIAATIGHVDTVTLRPSAARVTFHFDAHDKLLSYDMVPAEPAAIQQ
jgi:hypothetical protein